MKPFELNNQPKITAGFTVPENYFDDFSKKMQTRILEEKPSQKVFYLQTKSWLYAAAAVLVVSTSILFFNNQNNTITTSNVAAIDQYISSEADISEEEMIAFLDIKDIEKINIDDHINSTDITDILLTTNDLEQNLID
jgi:hypothetical protein